MENNLQVSLDKMEDKLTNKKTSLEDTLKDILKIEGNKIPKKHKGMPHEEFLDSILSHK